jgi:hypothetical protein
MRPVVYMKYRTCESLVCRFVKKVIAYGAVVTLNILRLAKLCEDILREDLSKLDTHLV